MPPLCQLSHERARTLEPPGHRLHRVRSVAFANGVEQGSSNETLLAPIYRGLVQLHALLCHRIPGNLLQLKGDGRGYAEGLRHLLRRTEATGVRAGDLLKKHEA